MKSSCNALCRRTCGTHAATPAWAVRTAGWSGWSRGSGAGACWDSGWGTSAAESGTWSSSFSCMSASSPLSVSTSPFCSVPTPPRPCSRPAPTCHLPRPSRTGRGQRAGRCGGRSGCTARPVWWRIRARRAATTPARPAPACPVSRAPSSRCGARPPAGPARPTPPRTGRGRAARPSASSASVFTTLGPAWLYSSHPTTPPSSPPWPAVTGGWPQPGPGRSPPASSSSSPPSPCPLPALTPSQSAGAATRRHSHHNPQLLHRDAEQHVLPHEGMQFILLCDAYSRAGVPLVPQHGRTGPAHCPGQRGALGGVRQ